MGDSMESALEDALEHIAGRLTPPQRRMLVTALVQANGGTFIQVRHASEHSVHALKRGPAPLIFQAESSMIRFLSPLGIEVARHLNRTGSWDIPQAA